MLTWLLKKLGYEKVSVKQICTTYSCDSYQWSDCTAGRCKYHCESYCKCVLNNRIKIEIKPSETKKAEIEN